MNDSVSKLLVLIVAILLNFTFSPLITVESRLIENHFGSVVITHFWIYLKTFYYYGLFTPLGFITLAFILFSFKENSKPNKLGAFLIAGLPMFGAILLIHLVFVQYHPWIFGADASEEIVSFYTGINESLKADFREIWLSHLWAGDAPRYRIVKELESLMSGFMVFTNLVGFLVVSAYMKDQ